MAKFASMSTRGFYTPEIHGENMPADVVEITDEFYLELLEGQSNGKVIDWSGNLPVLTIPDIVISIPQEVTKFQAKVALYQSGLLEAVEAEISKPETQMEMKLAWQDAQTFKRTSSFVIGMASLLGLTEQQLDDLFILAASVE